MVLSGARREGLHVTGYQRVGQGRALARFATRSRSGVAASHENSKRRRDYDPTPASRAPSSASSPSRFFSHAVAAARRSNVCACVKTVLPLRIMRICAVNRPFRSMIAPNLTPTPRVGTFYASSDPPRQRTGRVGGPQIDRTRPSGGRTQRPEKLPPPRLSERPIADFHRRRADPC
jgi:hypothetical protein